MNTSELKEELAKEIVNGVLNNRLDSEGKIIIPDGCKRVKLDVGLSNNAPHAEIWLEDSDDTCVYGFEPNPYNIQYMKNFTEDQKYQIIQLDPKRINKNLFIIETALSDGEPRDTTFYCTKGDPGTSSMYEPLRQNEEVFKVKDVINVPVITLKHFFDVFPWDKVSYIEQLKVDAQSADFDIIRGCGDYLSERIVYLDVEISTSNQYKHYENPQEFHNYIVNSGFEIISLGGNCSYYNKRYSNIKDTINYKFLNC